MAQWLEDEKELAGFIQLEFPDDITLLLRAKSVQGVHLEEAALSYIRAAIELDRRIGETNNANVPNC